MASVTVTIPDEQATRIVSAICAERGASPASLQEGIVVVQDAVFDYLRDRTLVYEASVARDSVLNNPDDPLVNAITTQG